MSKRILTSALLKDFEQNLINEEKSPATMEKYLRDITAFCGYAQGRPVTKELAISYKTDLVAKGYAARSVNSMLASINSFFQYQGWHECIVKCLRTQKSPYSPAEKELTKAEYMRLLDAAKVRPRLRLIMQTICGAGIRVSELSHFTVESVEKGEISINCKGKLRKILIPVKLKKKLLCYARQCGITSGVIFRTRGGKPMDRSNIWREMKNLCQRAGVAASKVFPHNLRKLFARTFYELEQDIAKLADILGHCSINTTRIYIMTTGEEHRKKIERLGLVV